MAGGENIAVFRYDYAASGRSADADRHNGGTNLLHDFRNVILKGLQFVETFRSLLGEEVGQLCFNRLEVRRLELGFGLGLLLGETETSKSKKNGKGKRILAKRC